MSHLRLVRPEPPPRPRRKYERVPLLTELEAQNFRQALQAIHAELGTWQRVSAAMRAPMKTIDSVMRGARGVSGDLVVRAMMATALGLKDLIGDSATYTRCRVCGAVTKRAA